LAQVKRLGSIAIAQMPSKERKAAENRAKQAFSSKGKGKAKQAKGKGKSVDDTEIEDSQVSSRESGLRDTIVAPYPNGRMALVIFEVNGDTEDEGANKLEFLATGKKIGLFARVPKELKDAASLIGNKKSKSNQDADCMLLDELVKKRLEGAEEDEDRQLWEPREVVELPFSCHQCLYNKHGDEIESYLLRRNLNGYAWGYFWLLGQHVKAKEPDRRNSRIAGIMEQEESEYSSNNNDYNDSNRMDCSSSEDDVIEEEEELEQESNKVEQQQDAQEQEERAEEQRQEEQQRQRLAEEAAEQQRVHDKKEQQ
jgi:hypothetical protein